MLTPLQVGDASPTAVAGTFAALALFLTLTAHIAARNVLGDVRVRHAFGVGPLPAAVTFVFAALRWPAFFGILLAIVVDGLAIKFLYGPDARTTAYITFIHAVVSVILGVVLFGLYALAISAPT